MLPVTTGVGFTTKSSVGGLRDHPAWSRLWKQTHMREEHIMVLIQAHLKWSARLVFMNIKSQWCSLTLSFAPNYVEFSVWQACSIVGLRCIISLQDNFVLHYEMVEKRPRLPERWRGIKSFIVKCLFMNLVLQCSNSVSSVWRFWRCCSDPMECFFSQPMKRRH